MSEVFVVHADTDEEFISRICETLAAADIAPWVDHYSCEGPSEDCDRQYYEALARCQCGLFVLSANSGTLLSCRNECYAILEEHKRLYILSIEPAQLEDFNDQSHAVQYIDLTRDFEMGMAQVIQSIKGQLALQTPLLTVQNQAISGAFPRWALNVPLLGRDTELIGVMKALSDGNRVTGILGLSGVGKTRLAVEAVSQSTFKHGVIWHTLSQYTSVADLTMLIRNHLNLDIATDLDAVWSALGKREVLLVLDGAEECAQRQAYAERLNILDLSGGTRVLLTSRQRWSELRDAKYHELKTPSLPVALQILNVIARREPPTIPIKGCEEAIVIAAHCRPKLIAYAVRWADAYPPDYVLEILYTLRGADAEQAVEDLVHKTVRMVEHDPGWPEAHTALRRLVVSKNGFTFEAARAMIKEPRPLKLLKDWGFISLDGTRYTIDPLFYTCLTPDETAYESHFRYYLGLAEQCDARQDYLSLEAEAGNLESAFEWAITTGHYAEALNLANICSNFLASQGRLDQRKTWFERLAAKMLNMPNEQGKSQLYASIQAGLGVAYAERTTGDRVTNLRRAITAFERAARYFTANRTPAEFARIQNNLGIAYRNLAETEDQKVNLHQAIAAFERAAVYLTYQNNPLEFAAIQSNLGGTYLNLASIEDRKQNLYNANNAFRRALAFFNGETAPMFFALTQNNLGATYADLAEVDSSDKRVDYLRKALGAFEKAMRFLTPQRAPMQYARVLYNLGHAYRNLAESYREPDYLRKAITAYNRTLRIWTAQVAPAQHIQTQTQLGHAYLEIAELEDMKQNLQSALEVFHEVLQQYAPRNLIHERVKIQVILGAIHHKLRNKDAALNCWREAEQYFRNLQQHDMADRLMRWITGQTDPGTARNAGRWAWQNKI